MSPELLFYLIIAIILVNFVIDYILDRLNASRFDQAIPTSLSDVYPQEQYERSQAYKKVRYGFAKLRSGIALVLTLAVFFLDGFAWLDGWIRNYTDNPIWVALAFFGLIMGANGLLNLPFSYYSTFVIEERFGFNKTTKKTFFLDMIKGALLGSILGGGLLAAIIWFYQLSGELFWLYAWGLVSVFSILMSFFYARLIVPLFNKQKPLEAGPLREAIETYAQKVGFGLKNIFVIDGSKRSTKANAYFSGFGREKRITLYDTLIDDLEQEEVVAVLAHEVGHYQKKHVLINVLLSVGITGITLWVLGLLIGSPLLSQSLGVQEPSFHIGLIAFGVLYAPLSSLTGLLMNGLSRKFEYQADAYAKMTYSGTHLIGALKKLSRNSMSNLTPHPAYVFAHYSHPTLLQRQEQILGD